MDLEMDSVEAIGDPQLRAAFSYVLAEARPVTADELLRPTRLRPANTLAAGAERVCAAIRQFGFHATVAEVRGDVAVIETAACPLRPLVREHAAVAEIDRGMWVGLAAHALEGAEPARIECDTHSCR